MLSCSPTNWASLSGAPSWEKSEELVERSGSSGRPVGAPSAEVTFAAPGAESPPGRLLGCADGAGSSRRPLTRSTSSSVENGFGM